jgi:hypothetical protein
MAVSKIFVAQPPGGTWTVVWLLALLRRSQMKEKIFALAKLVVLLVLLGTPIAAPAKVGTTEIPIDTATGAVKHFPFPDRILYKPWYQALPPYSRMVVISDRAVRILVHSLFSSEKIGYQLWTFDATNGHFLSAHVHLGTCGYGQFVLSAAANQLSFICPTTNGLRSIELDTGYHEVSNALVKFPWARDYGVSDGFLSPDGKVAIVRGDGAIYEWNAVTQDFSPTAVVGYRHRIV